MNRLPAVLVFTFCLSCGSSAASSSLDIAGLFDQANKTFSTANQQQDPERQKDLYRQAAMIYQRLIDEGHISNPKLYYNLANAYLLCGDIGRAILNYRRAEALDRTDANIQKNLAFARSRRADAVPVRTQQQVLGVLFFWHFDLAAANRVLLACVGLGVACLAMTIMIWLGRSSLWYAVVAVGLIVFLAMTGSVLLEQHERSSRTFGVIVAEQTVARQGDGPAYPEAFKGPLHAGTEFELIEARPGWLHIRLSDGSDGWIVQDAAELI